MRNVWLLTIGCLLLAGCGTMRSVQSFQINNPIEVSVGSEMIRWGTRDDFFGTSFLKVLVYGGIAQSVVNVTYKEFSGNLARPAFTQDLKYDISKSRLIKYQTIEMRIDSADQRIIRFVVLKAPSL